MTDFRARFEAQDRDFAVRADQALLDAAEQAGVAMPSSCRNGTCRTCMCRLREGQVHYLIAWPGILPEERAEGWILPCVAYPLTDVVLSRA